MNIAPISAQMSEKLPGMNTCVISRQTSPCITLVGFSSRNCKYAAAPSGDITMTMKSTSN